MMVSYTPRTDGEQQADDRAHGKHDAPCAQELPPSARHRQGAEGAEGEAADVVQYHAGERALRALRARLLVRRREREYSAAEARPGPPRRLWQGAELLLGQRGAERRQRRDDVGVAHAELAELRASRRRGVPAALTPKGGGQHRPSTSGVQAASGSSRSVGVRTIADGQRKGPVSAPPPLTERSSCKPRGSRRSGGA